MSIINTQKIKVPIDGRPPFEYIVAKQGEIESRRVEITLIENNKEYTIPGNVTARVKYYKPDGHKVINDCTISQNKIIVTYTEQMLAAEGTGFAEIALYSGNSVLVSATFYTKIVPSVYEAEGLISDSEYLSLNKVLIDTTQARDAAQNAKTNAEVATEAAIKASQILSSEKGKANGLATLNANAKIQSSQLDTSSDDFKVKLVNLAEEVQSAMAGTAPVISSVADGSLTTAKYADNSITSAKIANGAKLGIEQGMFPVNKFIMNIDTINEKITVSDSLLIFTDTYFYILQAGNYSYSDVAGVTDKTLINVYAKKNNNWVINQLIFRSAPPDGSSATPLDKNLIYLFTFLPGLSMETVTPYQPVLINGVKARHRGELAVNIEELNSCFTSKNLFNKNTVIKGFKGNVSSTTGAFAIDTAYCTSEYIPVDGSTAYYSNVDAIITQYNKGYVYLSRTTAKSITTLSNTRYVKISIPIANLNEEQFEKGTSSSSYEGYNLYLKSSHLKHKNVVIVDKQNGDYNTINAAVQANNGETIIVMPGDYYENVRAWVNKPINIVGVDKNKCILRHGCGQYANPPLEIAAGYVKNMTIYADSTNPVVEPDDNKPKSYAVHVESDYSANRELTFENCILKSNWAPAIGIGLRPNFKLTLRNCDLYANYEQVWVGSLGKLASLGALFFHPSAGYSSENQNLILDNCRLYSINDIVLCDYDIGISPYKATITAINTMLWSETKGKQESVIFHRVAPSGKAWGGSNIFLGGKSYGNNVEGLNS